MNFHSCKLLPANSRSGPRCKSETTSCERGSPMLCYEREFAAVADIPRYDMYNASCTRKKTPRQLVLVRDVGQKTSSTCVRRQATPSAPILQYHRSECIQDEVNPTASTPVFVVTAKDDLLVLLLPRGISRRTYIITPTATASATHA